MKHFLVLTCLAVKDTPEVSCLSFGVIFKGDFLKIYSETTLSRLYLLDVLLSVVPVLAKFNSFFFFFLEDKFW